MQVVLYTDQTISQALTALNARMQARATSSRPALDGWVEKNGSFSLGVTSLVAGRFNRTTHFRGKLERESGVTVIKGQVSVGATRENMIVIYIVIALMALALVGMGSPWLGVLMLPIGAALYIPLAGDAFNSALLIGEIQKTLKAKDAPPKSGSSKSSRSSKKSSSGASSKSSGSNSSSSRSKAASKPASKAAPADDTDNDEEDEDVDEITRVPVED